MKNIILSFWFICCCNSCTLLIKTIGGLKSPKIESKQSIRQFVNKNQLDDWPLYFLKGEKDSTIIVNNLLFGLEKTYLVYDKTGKRYCYQQESTCSADRIDAIFTNFSDSYAPCLPTDSSWINNLTTFLPHIQNQDGDKVSLEKLPNADYYVFWIWNKFMGRKKNLKDDMDWLSNLHEQSNANVALLQLNTDLLEEWGLEKGKKLKMTLDYNRKAQSGELTFSKMPYANGERQAANGERRTVNENGKEF